MTVEVPDLMPSGTEPRAYEKETFGSSPEMIKGGRRRKSRGKKSRKSRRVRRKTRGGKEMKKDLTFGNGSVPVTYGGKKRSGKRKRRGGSKSLMNAFKLN